MAQCHQQYMLTQHYLSSLVKNWGIIDLQCCNYNHFQSDLSSNFEPSTTIFHHKLVTREGRVLAIIHLHHPSSMTILVHLFIRIVIQKVTIVTYKYHMTLNTIFSVGKAMVKGRILKI